VSTETITLDRAGYDGLRQCAGLADVLLDWLETVSRLRDVGRTDYDPLRAAEVVAAPAREVLQPAAARERAKQLANLGSTQPDIEGVRAVLGH
jgi:hypothetical protein